MSQLTQYYIQKLSRNSKLLRNPLARLSGQAKEQRVDQGKKLWNMFVISVTDVMAKVSER